MSDESRYALEAQWRSDELLKMVPEEQFDLLWEWAVTVGKIDTRAIIRAPSDHAVKVLGMTTAPRVRWQEKTPTPQFRRQWIEARHWAVLSAILISEGYLSGRLSGLSYKRAHQLGAQEAYRFRLQRDLEETLFHEFGVL